MKCVPLKTHHGAPSGGRGRGRGRGSYRDLPEDVEYLTVLKGHKALVTALQLDVNTKQLYTGSQDNSVRVTDCERGEVRTACLVFMHVVLGAMPMVFIVLTILSTTTICLGVDNGVDNVPPVLLNAP